MDTTNESMLKHLNLALGRLEEISRRSVYSIENEVFEVLGDRQGDKLRQEICNESLFNPMDKLTPTSGMLVGKCSRGVHCRSLIAVMMLSEQS